MVDKNEILLNKGDIVRITDNRENKYEVIITSVESTCIVGINRITNTMFNACYENILSVEKVD